MRAVALPRYEGKTEYLLSWVQEAPEGVHRVIVSPTLMESHRVMRLAYDRGLIPEKCETWQFVSAEEVTPDAWSAVKRFRPGQIVLGFDNVDWWLSTHFPYRIEVVTMTDETGVTK